MPDDSFKEFVLDQLGALPELRARAMFRCSVRPVAESVELQARRYISYDSFKEFVR